MCVNLHLVVAELAVLELIGTPGYEAVSRANPLSARVIAGLYGRGVTAPVVAEIGVGIGATSLAIARTLGNRGQLHLFDVEPTVRAVASDLAAEGFDNIHAHPNSERHWDNYNWTLGVMLLGGMGPAFDYIYLDGARTFVTDALAFFLCDRLLRRSGLLEFNDYEGTYAASKLMVGTRDQFMTAEQMATPQVAMVVDLFLRDNPDYAPVIANRLFRKR